MQTLPENGGKVQRRLSESFQTCSEFCSLFWPLVITVTPIHTLLGWVATWIITSGAQVRGAISNTSILGLLLLVQIEFISKFPVSECWAVLKISPKYAKVHDTGCAPWVTIGANFTNHFNLIREATHSASWTFAPLNSTKLRCYSCYTEKYVEVLFNSILMNCKVVEREWVLRIKREVISG